MATEGVGAWLVEYTKILVDEDFVYIGGDALDLVFNAIYRGGKKGAFIYLVLELEHLHICP